MEIQYKYANGAPHTFEALDFILENDNRVFLIGYDWALGEFSILGLAEGNEGEFFLYRVGLGDEANAEDEVEQLTDYNEGEEYELYDYGFVYKRNNIPARLAYYLEEGPMFMVSHMMPTEYSYMIPSKSFGIYNKIELTKPTY